jgi:hypothetical protein
VNGTLDNSQAAILENLVMSEGKTFLYFPAITGFDCLQLTVFRLSQRPQAISTWDYFGAWFAFGITLAALNVVMFVRIGHHLKELRGEFAWLA